MNSYVKLTALFAIIILMQTACASGARNAGVPDFSNVRDRNWKLMEVRAGTNNVIFKRDMLTEESLKDAYTLRFDAEGVRGVGCPNRYLAPYTLGDKQAVDIKTIAGTLMASLFEPEQLKEREYFVYLENADSWNIVKGNLELRSTNAEGAAVFLIFNSAD
jgi:hypothetical protein